MNKKILFNLSALSLALFAIYCAVLMTEPGQVIGVPRDRLLAYYKHMDTFWFLQILALVGLWIANVKGKFWKPVWMYLASLGVVLSFWAQSYAMPTAFPTDQFKANYHSVEDADAHIPEQDTRVYVTHINGETRIFPRYHVQIPHVAGWEQDGTEYAITFCGLSNLPMVVETDYGLGDSNLQVLGQAHNNLIFKDVTNGTAIQQITMQSEFTDHSTKVHPNTMMEWQDAKELYPDAMVYLYSMDRMIDGILLDLFEEPLVQQRDTNNPNFIFNTLDLEDHRLNPKSEVFGIDIGEQQMAIEVEFARNNDGHRFTLGEQTLEIISNGNIVMLVDETGQQIPTHNGVHFGIWSQFFPNTEVLN
ncbi:DUF3179 domain-containing (seleno)protein [Vibrio ulleungensis]|uniref:DUF3179 domain-containing protein n=1 Tax=Vibrio ulleungensis TaxID=2807619 RepID=A0ABS2HJM4_9VIBR|nr:DUF3179 domain-containing (seleno)protein [Vibrio ulleungensis]MBM7037239.1 DUF3179 domain-containing protein [Vibrio ulleungensis]